MEGVSASMRPVEAVIHELAQSDVPVLVLAERGAGKHATAERIHEMSRHNAQPFRWLRCSRLKPADLEGETLQIPGTVYLDEIADLSGGCQEVLLSALLAADTQAADEARARLICGSASDLEVELKRGQLREDLY